MEDEEVHLLADVDPYHGPQRGLLIATTSVKHFLLDRISVVRVMSWFVINKRFLVCLHFSG